MRDGHGPAFLTRHTVEARLSLTPTKCAVLQQARPNEGQWNQHIQRNRQSALNQGEEHCDEMQQRVGDAFPHGTRQQVSVDGGINQRLDEEGVVPHGGKTDAGECHDRPICHHGQRVPRIGSQERRRKRDERQPEEEDAVQPQQRSSRSREEGKEMMVRDPPDADDAEAQGVAEEEG
jgi:hypothetical protein